MCQFPCNSELRSSLCESITKNSSETLMFVVAPLLLKHSQGVNALAKHPD